MVETSLGTIEERVVGETGLHKIGIEELTIRRVKSGRGVRLVKQPAVTVPAAHQDRIVKLAIPPAWSHVRISADPLSHIQAVGRDGAGRLQYIYHAEWETVRSAIKTERLVNLLASLPRIRAAIRRDLDPVSPRCALAAAARLVDRLSLRAGHEAYASEESGRGVATLLKRHVKLDGDKFSICYSGKGGKRVDKSLIDASAAAVLSVLRQQRGERLFKLPAPAGIRPMTAVDLNGYLAEISRKPLTAKDFRTLFASAWALDRLTGEPLPNSLAKRRRAIAAVTQEISEHLCNTPAVVRRSYILPMILDQYESGALARPDDPPRLRNVQRSEALLLRFLQARQAADPAL